MKMPARASLAAVAVALLLGSCATPTEPVSSEGAGQSASPSPESVPSPSPSPSALIEEEPPAELEEAIAEIENGSTPVALVITDMMMPVMDGAATTAYLEEHHPDLPIIASSGLSSGGESGSDPGGVGMGIARFLAKPYTTHTLITSVSDTLREHRTRTETQTEEDR